MSVSLMFNRLDEELQPREARVLKGLHWPNSWAAWRLAEYLDHYGDRLLLDGDGRLHDYVCEHIEMVRGWHR
jgi:hypothetical protein